MLAVALYGAHETGIDLTNDEVSVLHEFARAAVSGYVCLQMRLQSKRIEELEALVRTSLSTPADNQECPR